MRAAHSAAPCGAAPAPKQGQAAGGGEALALVEAAGTAAEVDVRARLASFGVAWCNKVGDAAGGTFLVRFTTQDSLTAAVEALHGSSWREARFAIAPCAVGALLAPSGSVQHDDSAASRADSIPAMQLQNEQLDYFNSMLEEQESELLQEHASAQQQQQQQLQQREAQHASSSSSGGATSAFQLHALQDLEPCDPEWAPPISADDDNSGLLLTALEDEGPLSTDDSPLESFSSNRSTSQLWSQRSIGAVARKDLAKFAAMQHMAQQHSCNSPTQAALLSAGHVMGGLGSPWGSLHSMGSNTSLASLATGAGAGLFGDGGAGAAERRASSPSGRAGLGASGMPSPGGYAGYAGAAEGRAQDVLGSAGAASHHDLSLILPAELGLGDGMAGGGGNHNSSSSEADEEVRRLHGLAAARQQYSSSSTVHAGHHQGLPNFAGMLSSYNSDGLAVPLASSSPVLGGVPPPPPPPPPVSTTPPPPPPRGLSPVQPAPPPPRSITPSGASGCWQSGGPSGSCSPRMGSGPQPPSYRGSPRAGARGGFQHSMSNLGYQGPGGYGSGDAYSMQPPQPPPPYGRVGSPLAPVPGRPDAASPVAYGMQPPPPPPPPNNSSASSSAVPPGYAAAAAAAAQACGYNVSSQLQPASSSATEQRRPGSACALAAPHANSRAPALAGNMSAHGASTAEQACHTPSSGKQLKADGALFVRELLQLLKQPGAATGNAFLCSLRDLLDCAVTAAPAAGRGDYAGDGRTPEGCPDAPVDAAAFLGMLQEAAAPLLAAAAQGSRTSQAGSGRNRAGSLQQHISEGCSDAGSLCGGSRGGAAAQSQGGGGDSSSGGGGAAAALADTLAALPLNLLLRHSLAGSKACSSAGGGGSGSGGASPLLFPLHPRTTTHSSSGGAGAGTPLGTPMLLVPQTVPELLSARAALIRLMLSAHAFVQGPAWGRMAARLSGIADVYDSMHDDPVVLKRRKCRDMAVMRDAIRRDGGFVQALSSVVALRNHIYSLSRKVLVGFGHCESLPIDLLLGGMTSELVVLLAEPADTAHLSLGSSGSSSSSSSSVGGVPTPHCGRAGAGSGSAPDPGGTADDAEGGGSSVPDGGSSVLPHPVVDFFAGCLPLPKLALLVFVEFVPVDPAPASSATPLPSLGTGEQQAGGNAEQGAAVAACDTSSTFPHMLLALGGLSGAAGSCGSGPGTPRDHHRSSSSGNTNGSATPRGDRRGATVGRWGPAGGKSGSRDRDWFSGGRDREATPGAGDSSRHWRDGGGSNAGSNGGSSTPRRSRGGSFNSQGGAGRAGMAAPTAAGSSARGSDSDGRRPGGRRSNDYDLAAEAAALEAAASAAAPLVAAAVCDLPAARKGSNSGK